jgi:nucleoid-associated protein YgaU
VFVEVFEVSAKDGTELRKVTRPVLLGSRMVKGRYIGYREHVVKKGDTLTKIAKKHKVDVDRLVRANAHEISDPDLIHPGQVIRIPIGTRD